MIFTPRELDAVLRGDLQAFTEKAFGTVSPGTTYSHGWHVEAMTHALGEVLAGRNQRLLITVPPRHMKSICAAVAFPAFVLGHAPQRKLLVASYGGDLALRHARDFRMVVESPWYARLFPKTVGDALRNTDAEFVTAANGSRRAVSLGGALTGLGADIIIIDDLMKAADANSPVERQRVKDFYQQTLYSRLNDKRTGAIIAIQQRLHEDDLAGYLIESGEFEHLNLPSIAEKEEAIPLGRGRIKRRKISEVLFEARENQEVLDRTRLALGPAVFSAQYQQNPTPLDGNLVRWPKIQRYEATPDRERLFAVVQSWDVAVTASPQSDWSVCSTWGLHERQWLLMDIARVRHEYPELVGFVRQHRKRWQPELVIVERTGAGRPLYDDLRADLRNASPTREPASWRLWAADPQSDKITRFVGQTAKLESGMARFPNEAPWLEELRKEFTAFPSGRYDDQVDSITQFLEIMGRGRGIFDLDEEYTRPGQRPLGYKRPPGVPRR